MVGSRGKFSGDDGSGFSGFGSGGPAGPPGSPGLGTAQGGIGDVAGLPGIFHGCVGSYGFCPGGRFRF